MYFLYFVGPLKIIYNLNLNYVILWMCKQHGSNNIMFTITGTFMDTSLDCIGVLIHFHQFINKNFCVLGSFEDSFKNPQDHLN